MTVGNRARKQGQAMNVRRYNDDPISTSEEDELERRTYYDELHRLCTDADVEEGLTIGVMGPWGSGKTSCLNILEKKLKEDGVAVSLFNPWLWEDEKQLLGHLLEVIGDMAKEEGIQDISKDIWRYRRALAANVMSAVAGPEVIKYALEMQPEYGVIGMMCVKLLERMAARCGGAVQKSWTEEMKEARANLEKKLKKNRKRLVVMVDDADRLEVKEMRHLFKAVRLAAKLPYVIYVIAVDKVRTGTAFTIKGHSGESYIEKIVEFETNMPKLVGEQKHQFITQELKETTERKAGSGRPWNDQNEWAELYRNILDLVLETPRDVKRYRATVEWACALTPVNVSLRDLMAIEAIKMKVPRAVEEISKHTMLVTASETTALEDSKVIERMQAAREEILNAAGESRQAVDMFLSTYLPRSMQQTEKEGANLTVRARQWRKKGRIAELEMLHAALGQVNSRELQTTKKAEQMLNLLDNRETLKAMLSEMMRSEEIVKIEDIVHKLADYEEHFTAAQARSAIPLLMDALSSVPERPQEFMIPSTDKKFTLIVTKLLEKLPKDAVDRELAKSLWDEIETLHGQARFIQLLELQGMPGSQLISNETCEKLNRVWMKRLKEANEDRIMQEKEQLFNIALHAAKTIRKYEVIWQVWGNLEMQMAIIRGARGENISYPGGIGEEESTIRPYREPRLQWESLSIIFGSEKAIVEAARRLTKTRSTRSEEDKTCLDLVWEHAAGRGLGSLKDEDEKVEIVIAYGQDIHAQIERIREQTETEKDLCERALLRGHQHDSVGAMRGLAPGAPHFEHQLYVDVAPSQKRWVEEKSDMLGVDVGDTWRTVLASGLDEVERERSIS